MTEPLEINADNAQPSAVVPIINLGDLNDEQRAELKERLLGAVAHYFAYAPAARSCGVLPSTFNRWRAEDPVFSELCKDAREEATDYVEGTFYRQAKERGGPDAQKWLETHRRDTYGKMKIEHSGDINIHVIYDEQGKD